MWPLLTMSFGLAIRLKVTGTLRVFQSAHREMTLKTGKRLHQDCNPPTASANSATPDNNLTKKKRRLTNKINNKIFPAAQSLNTSNKPTPCHCPRQNKKLLSMRQTNSQPPIITALVCYIFFLKKANSGEGKQACACPEA